jgi:hypothetical protein
LDRLPDETLDADCEGGNIDEPDSMLSRPIIECEKLEKVVPLAAREDIDRTLR